MYWPFRTHKPAPSPLANVPGDLLIEIALCLDSVLDVLNFSLTNNHIYSHVSSVLYETVTLNTLEQCKLTLGMLERRPDIARHVRELVVRPQTEDMSGQASIAQSLIASAAVRHVASTKRLDALTRFTWDADEKPYHDDMWFALRMGCPLLRYIGTSLGSYLPPHGSHIFDFVDLAGFSLTLKSGFYDVHMDIFTDEENVVIRTLWDMLMNHCPNLEELTIEGSSSLPINIHTLVYARWPNLRKLALGDVSVEPFPSPVNPAHKGPFIEFLEAHPKLDTLALSKFIIQPAHLATLNPAALQLSSFSGTLQQIQALPYLHPHLRSVAFRDPLQTREVPAQAVAALLQGMKQLSKLKVAFMLHSMYDSGNLLRSLITSCPHLRHLELTCSNKPSFQLDAFSKTVRGFPKLRTLQLTIVKCPGDEPLAAGAARIARSNPRLNRFSLTFLPPPSPLPLPFALPFPPFLPLLSARASGTFALTCDHHGLPLSLAGSEHEKREWPWGLGTWCSTKKWVRDLRVGRRREGSWWRLLLERSAAGEEMRVLLFCGMLVSLAVWGFLASAGGGGGGGVGAMWRPRRPQPEMAAVFSRALMKERVLATATI